VRAASRILVVSPDYPPPLEGGSLVWLYTMSENCARQFDFLTTSLKKGHEEVSSPHHKMYRRSLIADSHDPARLRLLVSYLYLLLWVGTRQVARNYDLVLANPGVVGNSLLIILGRVLRFQVVAFGFAEEITGCLYGKGLRHRVKRALMNFAYKRATGFIVVCDFCKDLLMDLGVQAHRVDVVPPVFNEKKFQGNTSFRRNRTRNVLSVGRLIERKGVDTLIDAVKGLRKELVDIRLNIVGTGPLHQRLSERICRENIGAYVSLKGAVSDEELVRLYRISDLFVLAHRMLENGDTEGCPLVFAEAGAHGLPVIGGTGGGASTIILDGTTGYIVNMRNLGELKSKIKLLLTDRDLAESMGQAGREKIQKSHSPEAIGEKYRKAIARYCV